MAAPKEQRADTELAVKAEELRHPDARFTKSQNLARQAEIATEIRALQDEAAALVQECMACYPEERDAEQHRFADAQRGYYETQARLLEERAERVKALREADLPKEVKRVLAAGSKLDQALAARPRQSPVAATN